MNPPAPARLILAALVGLAASCGHTPDATDDFADVAPKSSAPKVWNVSGMTLPGVGTAQGILPIGEEPMGPDASLAGSGQLEQAVAAAPGEPLPDGGALNLDSQQIMPDGTPATATDAQPQSPYDPALLNPPATDTPAVPGTESPAPAPAPATPPASPAPAAPAPAGSPAPAPAETPAPPAGQ